MPQDCHVLLNGNNNLRNTGDFLAAAPQNNGAKGGSWDLLNADLDGQPLCYSDSNVSQSVVAEATEPTGLGYKYGGPSTIEFASLNVTLTASTSGRYNVFVWVQVAQGDISLKYDNNGVDFVFASGVYHDGGNDWRLYRLSGNVRSDGVDDVLRIQYRVSGGTGEVYLGTCWATPEKLAFLPYHAPLEQRKGITVDGAVNTIPLALPAGGEIENRETVITFGGVRSWQKVSASVLSAVADELPFVKAIGKTVSVTGTNLTTLGSMSGYAEIFWTNPQGSPDFKGATGYQKIVFSGVVDGDGAAYYTNSQLAEDTWIERGGAAVPPVTTFVVVGATFELRSQVSSSTVGNSTAYVKIQIHDPENGFTLS